MPGKPSWTTKRKFAAAAAVVFLALLALFLRAFLAEPARTVDYLPQLNELRLANLPEGENAWPHYLRADELVESISRERLGERGLMSNAYLYMGSLRMGDWNDPDYAQTKALFNALLPALDVLETAVNAPRLDVPIERNTRGMVIMSGRDRATRRRFLAAIDPTQQWVQSNLSQHVRLCAVAVRNAAERADWDELLRAVRIGLSVAEHSLQQPFIRSQLVGASLREAIINEIAMLLDEHDFPADICATLRGMFDAHLTLLIPCKDIIFAERLLVLDFVDIQFTRSGFPIMWDPYDVGSRGPSLGDRLSNVGAYFAPNRDRVVRWYNESYDAIGTWWSEPARTRTSRPEHIPSPRKFPTNVRYLYGIASGALHSSLWQLESTLENIGAMRALLRVHEHRARTGEWPAALLDAAPPEETVSHITGEPLEYLPPSDERPRPSIGVPSIIKFHLKERDPFVQSKPRLPRDHNAILVGVKPAWQLDTEAAYDHVDE